MIVSKYKMDMYRQYKALCKSDLANSIDMGLVKDALFKRLHYSKNPSERKRQRMLRAFRAKYGYLVSEGLLTNEVLESVYMK